MFVIYFFILFF